MTPIIISLGEESSIVLYSLEAIRSYLISDEKSTGEQSQHCQVQNMSEGVVDNWDYELECGDEVS